jgi:hypothetical protein
VQHTLNEVSEEEQKVVLAAGSEHGLANCLVHLKAEGCHHYVQDFHQFHLQNCQLDPLSLVVYELVPNPPEHLDMTLPSPSMLTANVLSDKFQKSIQRIFFYK